MVTLRILNELFLLNSPECGLHYQCEHTRSPRIRTTRPRTFDNSFYIIREYERFSKRVNILPHGINRYLFVSKFPKLPCFYYDCTAVAYLFSRSNVHFLLAKSLEDGRAPPRMTNACDPFFPIDKASLLDNCLVGELWGCKLVKKWVDIPLCNLLVN